MYSTKIKVSFSLEVHLNIPATTMLAYNEVYRELIYVHALVMPVCLARIQLNRKNCRGQERCPTQDIVDT
jgi:hypothetical protein